ncbi:hypothetical protein LA080_006342 [Diaporthe eres]|uniref:Short-chain dehydrogenase n=1 Tax=Diaporthe vaccinii TaxID=105482 RepID=A0ABR4FE49_9PEZI|nr:hypothetical protein LA080_006342 [Diaporthe eres]
MAMLHPKRWTQIFPPAPTFGERDVGLKKGHVFIVTGGNQGVGFELCKLLRATGATVYIASRSKQRVDTAIETLRCMTPKPEHPAVFKPLLLDLNDLNSVRTAASEFAVQENRLDILWNNAGIGADAVPVQSKTAQGLEKFVGMHCVAALLFTQLLLPQLQHAAKTSHPGAVRVVWLSSIMAESHVPADGIDFSILAAGCPNGRRNYARSKAGNWILAHEYARRYGQFGIVSVAANPGNLKTNAFQGAPSKFMAVADRLFLYDPKFGGYTELYAGFSPDITLENNGTYILPFGRVQPEEQIGRPDILAKLKSEEDNLGEHFWKWCEDQAISVIAAEA